MSAPHPPAPRFLTLFVDASFCHRTHAAGYGAWAKKAAFEKGLIFGGRLPRGISNAGRARTGVKQNPGRHAFPGPSGILFTKRARRV